MSDGVSIQVVGLVRFSALTPDYYADQFDTIDKIAAHIFSPERMERRFHLFENLCLPSLIRQTDPNFTCAVRTSDRMPDQYLERLLSIFEPLDNIVCVPEAPDKQYQLLNRTYDFLRRPGRHSHCLSFRLDDDDAVDVNFVKRIRHMARALLQIHGPQSHTMISHNSGFYVDLRTDPVEVFDSRERQPLSVGSALLSPMDKPGNPYSYNHRKFAQHYNLYSDLTVPAFLRSLHPDNKSNPAQLGIVRKLKPHQIARRVKRHFEVDLEDLLAL